MKPWKEILFDARDIDHLVSRFSEVGLRQEIHAAEVHATVARCFGEDAEESFFHDYSAICRLAVDVVRSKRPKVKPIQGKVDLRSLKQSLDLVDLVGHYTTLRKQGKRFVGRCPIHSERHPSLVVYPDEQRWRCFGCNRGGDAIDFTMAVENVDFRQAVGILGGKR